MQEQLELDLEWLMGAFRGPLVGLLASSGAPWGEAEELAQEAFAEAWIGRRRFRGDPTDVDALGRWLRGIAMNLLAASRRRSERIRPLASEPARES